MYDASDSDDDDSVVLEPQPVGRHPAADVLEPQTLEAALADTDIAYYLVHCMRAGKDFESIERTGAENFAQAAARAGVKRIVYLGGLIPAGADSKHLISRRLPATCYAPDRCR